MLQWVKSICYSFRRPGFISVPSIIRSTRGYYFFFWHWRVAGMYMVHGQIYNQNIHVQQLCGHLKWQQTYNNYYCPMNWQVFLFHIISPCTVNKGVLCGNDTRNCHNYDSHSLCKIMSSSLINIIFNNSNFSSDQCWILQHSNRF